MAALGCSVEGDGTLSNRHRADIQDFFARLTGYLTAGDIEGLAAIYNYPALAVTAKGCLAISELW